MKNYTVIIAILVITAVIITLFSCKEKFSEIDSTEAWKFVQPGEAKDSISNYQSNLGNCLLRRIADKKRVCNSVVGLAPFPQISRDPKNFSDF